MVDAYLFAIRDYIRASGYGFDYRTCEVMPDGHPPPRAVNIFVAVHEKGMRNTAVRNLDERYGISLTLTMRVVKVPMDRVGDQMLAVKLARQPGPNNQPSFNAWVDLLRSLVAQNWTIMANANLNLAAWTVSAPTVYGFVEPLVYKGRSQPHFVGPDWFYAEPGTGNQDMGLMSELSLDDARRLQPQTTATGVFV